MNTSIFGKNKSETEQGTDNEVRSSIFQTLGIFKASLDRFEREKSEGIEEARKAKQNGDTLHYETAKKKIRICMINTKLVSEMMTELEIALALNSMDRMLGCYNACMEVCQKHHSLSLHLQTASKHLKERKHELDGVFGQYEELCKYLSQTRGGAAGEKIISDRELESIIGESTAEPPSNLASDSEIELRLKLIKNKL